MDSLKLEERLTTKSGFVQQGMLPGYKKNLEIFCEDTAYDTSVCTIHPHIRVEHVCRLLTTLELHDINVDCYGLFDESLVNTLLHT